MKLTFCWSIITEAEIPNEELAKIYDSPNVSSDDFAYLAGRYGALPEEEGEINGVYTSESCCSEVIWER